jgi:transposase
MPTQEEDVEVHALRKRGWSISAIARHVGRDRKTVRAHLAGDRVAGVRVPAGPDLFDRVEPYVSTPPGPTRSPPTSVRPRPSASISHTARRVAPFL